MPEFRVRALEIHSSYAWDFDWVRKALAFIKDHGMTALVLHRNDIVDMLTYPATVFGRGQTFKNIVDRYRGTHLDLYKYVAHGRSTPVQRRDYMLRVIDLAARQGTEVWLENKELWFHDVFVEFNPQVFKNGTLCPSEPAWWDFIRAKYTELFSDISGIDGIITAPATRESRLSISGHRCSCEICRAMAPQDWYRNLLSAMYEPIHAAGKTLVVRDFVFDLKTQSEIAAVMEQQPEDVVIALKNTPHDYYPTFPDNPRIGKVGQHRQWVEFDTMAQYFGWGVGPSHMVDDMRYRMGVARDHGIDGVLIRTDWEALESHSCFHTPNLLNLHAAAALSIDRAARKEKIYREWLSEQGYLKADAGEKDIEEAVAWFIDLLGDSWEIIRRSLYTNDCVFSDSSTYPVSLDHAWWLAEEKNSLRDWDPTKQHAMDADEPNVRRILAEKDEAVQRVEALSEVLARRPAALTDASYREFAARIDVFQRYVRGFREIGHACILTKYIVENPSPSTYRAEAEGMLADRLEGLLTLAREFRAFRDVSDARYTTYLLLGPDRLEVLHDDLKARLSKAANPRSVTV
ncbi:hypothetical protein [Shumkonia mesophila]|uniref:hypothetical protein n=1 Tax=Shumkonia mesophila TaxID=2838854 RepID=UPI00293529CC|nr:hypothetical protein [Shumkonia mesophila]